MSVQTHLRNTFLAGTFAAAPVAVTVALIWWVESTVREFTRINIPFVGVLLALVGIYLLGLAVTSFIGKALLNFADRVLSRVPIFKTIYQAWKQISLTAGGREGVFTKVVLVPDETGRTWVMGFTEGTPIANDPAHICVFVPAAPNPMNGRLYFARASECRMTDLTTEEAFKLLLSGGNYVPDEIGLATKDAPAVS
ncbi:MAG TPA: DUF502 domain-containing protein [Tepidisphaeraceae bacterium]|jgi:uncharacterized membrane protein|nr:DUF502 domain-containing protein [Tepidisphaeraceae bacterium]